MQTVVPVSERRACRGLAQPRRTQRSPARVSRDEPALIDRLIALAQRFGRYGYRRITALLRAEGWRVNHKRVERLWRQEGLRVPRTAPRRRRLWATDGSCPRCRAERPHHVWPYAFVRERTQDGRPLRLRTIVDEHTRGRASASLSRAACGPTTSWRAARLSSCTAARRPPSAPTTAPSSRPRLSGAGSSASA